MPDPPPRRSWLARAARSATPIKTIAGAAVAIAGLIGVVLPLLGSGGDGVQPAAEFVEGRLTQPMLQDDFERLGNVLKTEAAPSASTETDASASWPGAWISLRILVRGVEETRFTWAVLEKGTNDVTFTSADADVSETGPAPSSSETPVQADVWVPFPARAGRYFVIVYLLPEAGRRLDEYVSPSFAVSAADVVEPPESNFRAEPEGDRPRSGGTEGPLPEIDVPDPAFSPTS